MEEHDIFNSFWHWHDPYHQRNWAEATEPIKVVKIPVTCKNSNKDRRMSIRDKESAAKIIQAAFRGFCVRRWSPLAKLRIIRGLDSAAWEISRRVADPYFAELIRSSRRERLKVTEEIMSLLLKLDEIQGVDDFVRSVRRSAVGRVVQLQETVDRILDHNDGSR